MIVLDTTVLVYAVGAEHDFRQPCRTLIKAIDHGDLEATTTIQVIQEFAHVRARRRNRSDAADLARDYVDLLSPLLIAEESDLTEGLRTFESQKNMGCFDCVLAAAAHAAGARALVSADAHFSGIPNITHVVPDDEGIRDLLAS